MLKSYTVKHRIERYGVGTYGYIHLYTVLEDGRPLPGFTDLTSETRAEAYAKCRNDGMSNDQAIEWVLDNVYL